MDEIGLAIARLKTRNEQLKKMLKVFEGSLNQAETNGILDEIGKNLRYIAILEQKRGH